MVSVKVFFSGCAVAPIQPANVEMMHYSSYMSNKKKPPTFHYTGWLIRILIMVYYTIYLGSIIPCVTETTRVCFIADMKICLEFVYHRLGFKRLHKMLGKRNVNIFSQMMVKNGDLLRFKGKKITLNQSKQIGLSKLGHPKPLQKV